MAVDFRDLVQARVHFGHRTTRWCPKMAPFIWGHKNHIHLINVAKTAVCLDNAAQFIQKIAQEKKQILWVGTKKVASQVIEDTAKRLDDPYVSNRWIGGTVTNFSQVKKSVTKLKHFEDILEKSSEFSYTKKELNKIQKTVEKLRANVSGIADLIYPISAIVVVDVRKESAAIREAVNAGIPVVALVDTNADPSDIDYVIPANDDAVSSVTFIINYLANAAQIGKDHAKKAAAEKKEQEASEKKAQETPPEEQESVIVDNEDEAQEEDADAKKTKKIKRSLSTRTAKRSMKRNEKKEVGSIKEEKGSKISE